MVSFGRVVCRCLSLFHSLTEDALTFEPIMQPKKVSGLLLCHVWVVEVRDEELVASLDMLGQGQPDLASLKIAPHIRQTGVIKEAGHLIEGLSHRL